MPLELKDLQSSQTHTLESAGALIGSDAARVRVLAKGPGVAAVHARIFSKESRWWLEDLGSPSGTTLGGVRIKGTAELKAGAALAVGGYRFQVTRIGDEAVDDLQALLAEIDGATSKQPLAVPASSSSGARPPGGQPRGGTAASSRARDAFSKAARGARIEPSSGSARTPLAKPADASESAVTTAMAPPAPFAASEREPAAEAEDPATTQPSTMVGASDRSIADLLSSLVSLLVVAIHRYGEMSIVLARRPRASLRAGVVEPQVGPLDATELVAWALPPAAALALAAALPAAASTRPSGAVLIYVLGTLSLAALAAVVAAVLVAALWHPVTGALIGLLGGASDARLRSNALVALGTALLLFATLSLAGALLGFVPWRGAGALRALFWLAGSAPVLAVCHAWGSRLGLGRLFDALLVTAAVALTAVAALGAYRSVSQRPSPAAATARVNAELEAAAARLDDAKARLTPQSAAPASGAEPSETARTSIAEYRRRRDYIDRVIHNDTAVLERVEGVARLYKRVQRESERLDKELAKRARKGRAPSRRQREALLQARTGADVDAVYDLLTRGPKVTPGP